MHVHPETTESQFGEGMIARRKLGRTGHLVSVLGLGGGELFFHQGNRDQAHEILNRALELGINYFDTSPTYGDSEILLGEILKDRGEEVFVATKVHGHTRDDAWRSIEESMKRLQTDFIHLVQLHDIETRDDIVEIMKPTGAIHALVEAEDQKLIRWIGLTGHADPDALLYGLERYDFDTILMPINIADRQYLSFIDTVLPKARERFMGVIGMKVFCAGGILESLEVTAEEAIRYALSQEISTAVIGVETLKQLYQNIEAASCFDPMSEKEQNAILDRTRDKAVACNTKIKKPYSEPV